MFICIPLPVPHRQRHAGNNRILGVHDAPHSAVAGGVLVDGEVGVVVNAVDPVLIDQTVAVVIDLHTKAGNIERAVSGLWWLTPVQRHYLSLGS
ncbi:MAG: hypothetical protein IMY87_06655 [Chloroflexi bacterium]|nr:hypothetical protein [Chloroflexota bacterium]